ncbi:MAG: YebC/PmpR family DNA-binding transcriptional regulator, partial [Myxococcales bacterium]|nr:YebC/PmpR family DNA-binding transcriptional regulator [Myxococcales bacterium]
WMFDRVGVVEASHPDKADPEEAAIEAGAQDVKPDEESSEFICEAADLDTVRKSLEAAGWLVSSAELAWVAKNPVTVDDDQRREIEAWVNAIDENDDVHRVYVALA